MPKSLSPGDRKILFVAGGAFLLLVILGFLFAPASNTGASSATTYSTASEGAKAAYLLLQETGYHVDRWQHPFSSLNPDSNTVVIIADPAIIPNAKQKAAVEQFVSGGGRVITTGVRGARFLPEDSSEYNEAPKNPWTEFKALSPSAITRAAPKLTLAPHAHWSGNLGIGLYGDDEQTVVTHFRHGKGDIPVDGFGHAAH